MTATDRQYFRRKPEMRAWREYAGALFILTALLLTVCPAGAGTYFMYRDKPLRPSIPKRFAPSPQLTRPFDYRKEYTPRLEFQRAWFIKSLPPLDPRVKPPLSFTMDFESFLLECASGIRSVMSGSAGLGTFEYAALTDTVKLADPAAGRGTFSLEGRAAANHGPVRLPEFRGPVQLAASGGEMQTAPEDMMPMLADLARAVGGNTPIKTKIDSLASLGSPGLRTVPFLLLSFARQPVLSANEKNHLRRYLRGGGFALVYGEPLADPETFFNGLFPGAGPGEARMKPIPPGHPLYHSCFDLPDGTESSPQPSPLAKPPVGIWVKERLAAVCLARTSGFWSGKSPDDPELKLGVNLAVFALVQPGGIASIEAEGAVGRK